MKKLIALFLAPFMVASASASSITCGDIAATFNETRLVIVSANAPANGVAIKDLVFDKFNTEIKTTSYTVTMKNEQLYINGHRCKHDKPPVFTKFQTAGNR